MENEVNLLINWIKTYVKNSGAKGVVVGNSGGKDSAVVIGLCAKALGSQNVLTVAMPCMSNPNDLEDAKLVSNAFDVQLLTVDLSNTYTTLTESIEEKIEKQIPDYSAINIKPRLRMTTLYAIAQTNGYLVAGTGNMCEIFVGYTTKWGDSASDFNPLAEYIKNGTCGIEELDSKIEKLHKQTEHKRNAIPVYNRK